MSDSNESRVKVKVWQAPNNGKPRTSTGKNPKNRKAIFNGGREAETGNIGKPGRSARISRMFGAKEKVKDRSSIWLAAERLRAQSIGVEAAKSSGKRKSPVSGALISKLRQVATGIKAQSSGDMTGRGTDSSKTDMEKSLPQKTVAATRNEWTRSEEAEAFVNDGLHLQEDWISKMKRTETDRNEKASGVEAGGAVNKGAPFQEDLTSKVVHVEVDSNEKTGVEKAEASLKSSASFQEDLTSKVERTEAGSGEKASGVETTASANNNVPVQEGLVSKAQQVKADRNDRVCDRGLGSSAINGKPAKESLASKVKQAEADRNASSGSQDKKMGKLTNVKPSREGWFSPDYSTSEKVKLDYRAAARNRCVCFFPDLPYVEHYKMLRTQIQQRCGEKGWNTIMVTSVNPSEGKTLTAINLSVVLAKEFEQTVLLVDADLRKQNVHKYMGYQASRSLVDYLETDIALSDVIVWPGVEKLTVISGENTVKDSTEILGSPRMGFLVKEMKSRYPKRYIIFDVPPVLDHADAMAFAPLMDAILVVVKPGSTDLKDIVKTTELLPKEKIIGYAMNRFV